MEISGEILKDCQKTRRFRENLERDGSHCGLTLTNRHGMSRENPCFRVNPEFSRPKKQWMDPHEFRITEASRIRIQGLTSSEIKMKIGATDKSEKKRIFKNKS